MVVHKFNCPYCGDEITMLLEQDQKNVEYIEDCETCYRPMAIRQNCTEFKLITFIAKQI